MKRHFLLAAASAAALILAGASAAQASVLIPNESSTYTLSVVDPLAGLGAGPYGSVSILELTANSIRVTVDLNDPTYQFKDSGNNHPAVAFNIAGDPSLNFTFSSPSSGTTATGVFTGTNTNQTSSPFGTFNSAVLFDANPNSANFAGPLVFTISSTNILDITSFQSTLYQGQNIFFTVDARNTTNGNTGNIGAVLTGNNVPGGAVPEPATWGLMILGFGGVGAMIRRRKTGMVFAA